MEKFGPAVVVDNGSGSCKAGYAGDHHPEIVFPSKVGRPRTFVNNYGHFDLKDSYVGHEAQANRQVLHIKHPVERGIIKNWDDMQKLWQHTYKELDLFSDEHPILLTDVPYNPEVNRERMAEIMFETFRSQAIYIAVQGVLALYAYGLITGVAVDCGADVTQIVPTSEGYFIPEATHCLELGGQDLDVYLMKMLSQNGIDFSTEYSAEDACEIKEKHCYVATDFGCEMKLTTANSDPGKTYELPDKRVITIKSEQFQCPEAYFQPSFLGKEFEGLHKTCYKDIVKSGECFESIKEELFANIVLSGGSSMFSGFSGRMQKELQALAPPNTKLNVMGVPSREHNVWLGGSIIASQSAFKEMWLTKKEYEESGPPIVHKKCV